METNSDYMIGILADDLTSAADGAAPFVARGHRAMIGRHALPQGPAAVTAVDSRSRSMSEIEAAAHAAQFASQLASSDILYKTVDSTLRGHVRVELEAAFKASGREMLVFAPAFPAAGRTTIGGIQLVDGIPVTDSLYGQDPVHPARHSRLTDLVPASIGRVVILDATTQAELDAQVEALPEPGSILWVGSPGMAAALARRFDPTAQSHANFAPVSSDILVAIGSANPVSHRQADLIGAMPGVALLRAPIARDTNPATVLDRIAAEAASHLRRRPFGALIATGGDTLEAVLDRLGISAFEILQEIEPAFPLGRAEIEGGRSLLLAMKAGGFGDDHALRRAIEFLRSGIQEPEQVFP